jgi:hypothetical protein
MSKPIACAALLAAAIIPNPSSAQTGEATVVTAGSEQAIRIGTTVVPRPFAGELVDRLAVVGTYSAPGEIFYLVRGDTGGACPSRFVVIVARGQGAPRVTEPFGTCSARVRATLVRGQLQVAMAGSRAGGPPVRFGYDAGAMRPLDPVRRAASPPPGRLAEANASISASGCRPSAGVDADQQAAIIADFQHSYPEHYRKVSSLNRIDIAPGDLRSLVVGLACLSTLPGAQDIVPSLATPLFASKRHGPAAFDTLETVSHDGLSDVGLRAATRLFNAEMTYRVARRGPL